MNKNKYVSLGDSIEAQTILSQRIEANFPQLRNAVGVAGSVIEKFFDWLIPYPAEADGSLGEKSARKWATFVDSWCARNIKLQELEELFQKIAGDEDGVFEERTSGNDSTVITKGKTIAEKEFTDNLEKTTETTFRGVGITSTGSTADKVTNTPTEGKNTQKEVTKTTYDGNDMNVTTQSKTRTYVDGRTIQKRMEDAISAYPPILYFVNGFALCLVEPCED